MARRPVALPPEESSDHVRIDMDTLAIDDGAPTPSGSSDEKPSPWEPEESDDIFKLDEELRADERQSNTASPMDISPTAGAAAAAAATKQHATNSQMLFAPPPKKTSAKENIIDLEGIANKHIIRVEQLVQWFIDHRDPPSEASEVRTLLRAAYAAFYVERESSSNHATRNWLNEHSDKFKADRGILGGKLEKYLTTKYNREVAIANHERAQVQAAAFRKRR